MEVTIRRALPGDAADLARMRAASRAERAAPNPEGYAEYERRCAAFFFAELQKHDSFVQSWVAVVDGAIVGGASLTVVPTMPRFGGSGEPLDGRIRDVYVVPSHRRSGIGRTLTLAAVEEARRLGVDRLSLGASEMGRPLYERIGFIAKADEMVFES